MSLGHGPLYVLPFDHRGSFQKGLFGVDQGQPLTADQRRRIEDLKLLVYEGLEQALRQGASAKAAGVLVDEEFGAEVARRAKRAGLTLAMPVEKSGQDEFDFEYGADYQAHIAAFAPDYVKVLVRYNPEGDLTLNARQESTLAGLSQWLAGQAAGFLFELLVPATPAQMARVAGDKQAYAETLLPDLVVRAMAQLQTAGVEPDVWKIQGLETSEDCQRAATQARAGGRERVFCIILGHGADDAQVTRWLQAAAGVAGYDGFAIGRTIWWQPVVDHQAGRIDRAQAVHQVADRYLQMIAVYEAAKRQSSAGR
ncbi:MAG: 2-deoxy-5-keto-D-gluconate 6-phosphate aldolase domain-containing protein [Sulfobacillus sp.]